VLALVFPTMKLQVLLPFGKSTACLVVDQSLTQIYLDELNLDLMGFLLVLSYVYLGEKKEKVFRPSLLSNPLNGVFITSS